MRTVVLSMAFLGVGLSALAPQAYGQSPPARGGAAAPESRCNPKSTVCVGDVTYAYYEGELHHGKVQKFIGGWVQFLKDGEEKPTQISAQGLATTKAGQCSGRDAGFCVGTGVQRGFGEEATIGKIAAIFETGFVVMVDSAGKPLGSFSTRTITRTASPADLASLKTAITQFNQACQTIAAPAPGAKCYAPATTLKRPGSFAQTLLTPQVSAPLASELGANCTNFLQRLYRSGATLATKTLMDAAKPIKLTRFPSGLHAQYFYHYAGNTGLAKALHPEVANRTLAHGTALNTQGYDKALAYYKTRPADAKGLWNRVTYVAEDPITSQYAGAYRTSFLIDPDAKTIVWSESLWIAAIAEIETRHPGFTRSCASGPVVAHPDTYGTVNYKNISFVIAEESGIDLIDYNSSRWFMLLGTKSIDGTRLEKCEVQAVPRGFKPEAEPGKFKPTCVPYTGSE